MILFEGKIDLHELAVEFLVLWSEEAEDDPVHLITVGFQEVSGN